MIIREVYEPTKVARLANAAGYYELENIDVTEHWSICKNSLYFIL
jgi:hypothetical protein